VMGVTSLTVLILTLVWAGLTVQNEILVSVGDQIEHVPPAGDGSKHVVGTKHIIGLSNPVLENNELTIFAAEYGYGGPSVFKIKPNSEILLVEDFKKSIYLEDIVYDQTTNKLYMTSKNTKSIYMMQASQDEQPETFLSSPTKKPTGIAIDTCSRYIFWTNSARRYPSIETINLDNGKAWTVTRANLTNPRAITIDEGERKLYWTDTRSNDFWIWRSNLDGSVGEIVCKIKNQEAFSIVVQEELIYWSDWRTKALWKTRKFGNCTLEMVKKFKSKPHGIAPVSAPKLQCDYYDDNIDQPDEKVTEVTATDSKLNATCTEPCINGVCLMIKGQSACTCYEGYMGYLCEIDMCYNFCLESGQCIIIENQPECLCPEGFEGDRCEVKSDLQSKENVTNKISDVSRDQNVSVYILGSVTVALSIVVIVLTIRVYKQRLRPRIVTKRFIAGTSRKKGGVPGEEVIELDVEDCCDMTVCDTPCFESRKGGPIQKKILEKFKKHEDLKCILEDEE